MTKQTTVLWMWLNFEYLGSWMQGDSACAADLKHRTDVVVGRFSSLWCIWKDAGFPHRMMARLYKVGVQSTNVWMSGTNAWMSAVITGHSAHKAASSPSFDIMEAIKTHWWRWLGHILRMSEDRHVRPARLATSPQCPLYDYSARLGCSIWESSHIAMLWMAGKTNGVAALIFFFPLLPCGVGSKSLGSFFHFCF